MIITNNMKMRAGRPLERSLAARIFNQEVHYED